jgi:hypothetical protein
MLKPLSNTKVKSTVSNIVAACKNIEKLQKRGYNYLYLCSGFIAHYNIHGFKDYYSGITLRADILMNAKQNEYRNFAPGDENYEYYHQKAQIYAAIVNEIKNESFGSYVS